MNQVECTRAFVTVASQGSFSAAARKLGRDVSVVNRQVSSLEEHLGVKLLGRLPRRIGLTDDGLSVLPLASEFLDAWERMQEAARGELGSVSDTIAVVTSHALALTLVAPVKSRLPHLNFDVYLPSSAPPEGAIELRLDVRFPKGRPSGGFKWMGSYGWTLLAAPGLLKRFGGIRRPQDLCHPLELLMVKDDERYGPWFLVKDEERVQISAGCRMTMPDPDLVMSAAAREHGIALVPDFIVERQNLSGRLVEVLPQYQVESGFGRASLAAHFPSQFASSVALRAVLEALQEELRSSSKDAEKRK